MPSLVHKIFLRIIEISSYNQRNTFLSYKELLKEQTLPKIGLIYIIILYKKNIHHGKESKTNQNLFKFQ